MTKKLKTNIVIVTGILMIVSWALLYLTGTKDQTANYVWQAFMAFFAIFYGFLGLLSAKHWGGTKSSNGLGVLSISLGLISWGLGQAGWTYYLFAEPNVQSPSNHFIDALYMLAIPLWAFGIVKLSKATGAKYGFKSTTAKVLLVLFTVVAYVVSYYLLVTVARGGPEFIRESFWKAFFDIGYVFGDVIVITMVLSVYGLSWKYLGGLFKKPIIIMFMSFIFLYLADFWWAFRDGKGLYYNGDTPDLFYILTVITFGLGLTLLDPSEKRQALRVEAQPNTTVETPPVAQEVIASPAPAVSPAQAETTVTAMEAPAAQPEMAAPAPEVVDNQTPAPESNNQTPSGAL